MYSHLFLLQCNLFTSVAASCLSCFETQAKLGPSLSSGVTIECSGLSRWSEYDAPEAITVINAAYEKDVSTAVFFYLFYLSKILTLRRSNFAMTIISSSLLKTAAMAGLAPSTLVVVVLLLT